ncbi:hypothetical protein IEQ34_003686 [Dendrobium chrysotoxum]|uniref:Uncharacterized protein n=1 Tax=Dendrobium chrysotoxum TaxID=161865 RepID=A0AAV7HFV6_DENCH|nr:hypothetical protein IEQ34_003686 [Dendrobium chrysotoxum]
MAFRFYLLPLFLLGILLTTSYFDKDAISRNPEFLRFGRLLNTLQTQGHCNPLSATSNYRPPPSPPPATTSDHHRRPPPPSPPATTSGHRRPSPLTATAGHHLRHHQQPPLAIADHHRRPPPTTTSATTSNHLWPPPTTTDNHLRHHQQIDYRKMKSSKTNCICCYHVPGRTIFHLFKIPDQVTLVRNARIYHKRYHVVVLDDHITTNAYLKCEDIPQLYNTFVRK